MKTTKPEETVLIKVKVPKLLKAKAVEAAKAEMRTLNAVFVLALKARLEPDTPRSKAS